MYQQQLVKKSNNELQNFCADKIKNMLIWAAEGLEDISIDMIQKRATVQFYTEISTQDIQNILIKVAADLISTENPDYQYVASKLSLFSLRKAVYKSKTIPSFYEHVLNMVEQKQYDNLLLKNYSVEEFTVLQSAINHDRDFSLTYAAYNQMASKYLLKNRITGLVYETPQMLYMALSACIFMHYPNDTRLKYVVDFYNMLSTFKISLPTPIMAGLRSCTKQFSSCVLLDVDDTLDSINATATATVNYISKRAGIGLNVGRIRAIGSAIRGGEAFHTGCIPFYKYFSAAVKSCSQGSIRSGSATLFYPIWHLEVEDLLVLKNNRGIEENRVRQLDYGVQLNKLMYQRLLEGGEITLFSPSDVPGLYEAFFQNQDLFNKLYIQAEKDLNIRKKSIKAADLFGLLAIERSQTGRIYIQNVDHCNDHSSFNQKAPSIKGSNLCMEITLPTTPISHLFDETGEVALCTLAAINLGNIKDLSELEHIADLLVRALDSILDYQYYPIRSAEITAKKRRSLGIGVINYAYYLAKHNTNYDKQDALELTHKTFEAFQYYLLKASCMLAKEIGSCDGFKDTKYADGLLPIDHYKRTVDDLCNTPLQLDWESLRSDILTYGLRNSTLSAIMPCEASSLIANATNGIEAPRGLVSIKQSKDGVIKQVVFDIKKYKSSYQLLWDRKDNNGYLYLCAIIQKFIDQSISINTNYDPSKYDNRKVPLQDILNDIFLAYKYGLKTLYYHNTRDNTDQIETNKLCVACSV